MTAGLTTQAETQKEAGQRQAAMPRTALWRKGHIRPKTHTYTGIHTQIHRERKKNTQRQRDRERRENGRHTHRQTHTHTHTHTESYSRGEQPTGTQVDPSSRSRTAARLLGTLTPANTVRACLRLVSRAASPVSAWGFIIMDGPLRLLASGDVPFHPVER